MAVVTPPLFLDVDTSYGADELGLPFRDLIAEGVVGADDLEVTENSPTGMSVRVAAGAVWVKGDDNANTQPTYRCYNDGTVTLTIDAADGSNPRKDLVIAEVRDSTFSGASLDWRLRVVKGTPAGSPAEPALPNNAHKLAVVTVGAGVTSIVNANIADERDRALIGGEAMVDPYQLAQRGATDGQSLTWSDANSRWEPGTPGSISPGDIAQDGANTGEALVWDGAAYGPGTPSLAAEQADASADLTLSTSFQDVTGATLTLDDAGTYLIIGTFNFDAGDAGAVFEGQLVIDGTANTDRIARHYLADATYTPGNNDPETMVSQFWLTAVGASEVVKLRARASTGSGSTDYCRAENTNILALRVA